MIRRSRREYPSELLDSAVAGVIGNNNRSIRALLDILVHDEYVRAHHVRKHLRSDSVCVREVPLNRAR